MQFYAQGDTKPPAQLKKEIVASPASEFGLGALSLDKSHEDHLFIFNSRSLEQYKISSWASASSISSIIKACKFRPPALHEAMFQYVAQIKDKSWQPGPYPGVELLVLHKHEATGGVTALRKFRAGVTVPAHTHPLANEFVYVLAGEWEESGVSYKEGSYFFAPRGQRHGPHVARTEVISLTVFDGPLTVE